MKRFVWVPVAVTVIFLVSALLLGALEAPEVVAGPWTIPTLVATVAGALIITRRSSHPIGWMFTAFGLLTSGGFALYALATQTESPTTAGWADAVASAFATVAVILLPAALLRFPDGLLPSSRWRWLSPVIVLTAAVGGLGALLNGGWGGDTSQAIAPSPLRELTQPWGDIASNAFYPLMVVTMAGAGASLIVRFRRVSGPAREQMKWLAVSASLLILAFVLAVFFNDGGVTLVDDAMVWVVAVAFASVPAAVAIAIIRYRLYDIDRIINRTIVYGLATGAVLAVYAATVFAASTLAAETSNNLTVALATLLAAAAFRPALRRVQRFVDRRFYRRRFNVQTTIDRFGSRLSHGTNLDELTDDLVGVVRNTMQPEQVGVWLRRAETSRSLG